jgi:hypothetical protein
MGQQIVMNDLALEEEKLSWRWPREIDMEVPRREEVMAARSRYAISVYSLPLMLQWGGQERGGHGCLI